MTEEEVWDMINDFGATVEKALKDLDDNELYVDLKYLLPVTQKWNAVLMALTLYQRGKSHDAS